MKATYFDHPTEESLERFLLHHSSEEELEIIETHILACESCVTRLEDLEIDIAARKLVLQEMQNEQALKSAQINQRVSWKSWFTFPKLSLAGGVAAVALGVALVPQFNQKQADVTLSAYRGAETVIVPQGRPLHLHLNAKDLAAGPVNVQILNGRGLQIWEGASAIRENEVIADIPGLSENGNYFAYIYENGDLVRAFSFRAQ